MIRPMRTDEDEAVRAIYRACHVGWPERPALWFEAHPTLVLEVKGDVVGRTAGGTPLHTTEIVGYTSYSVVMQPDVCPDGEVMIGYGIDIKPGYQGKGYGHDLIAHRLNIARAVGAKVFVGHASPKNKAMIALFEHDGFVTLGQPSQYPDGTPMWFFIGPVK